MAGFKEQIKAKFKAKFPNVTLSNARLDSIVDKLDAKTDTEDTIDAALDGINDITPFEEMAKIDDKIRTLENKGKPKADPAKPDPKPNDPPEGETATEKLLREILEGQKSQAAEIAAIKGEKTITTRKQALTDKLKNANETFRNSVLADFDLLNFPDEDSFTAYADRKAQEWSNLGLGKDAPGVGGGKPTGKEASQAELDAVNL